jgi:hypothetical protein
MKNQLNWKIALRQAFAGVSADFGVHPSDKLSAIRMFHLAIRDGVSLDEIINEARNYLISRGVASHHIEKDIQRIIKFQQNPMNKRRISRVWLITQEEEDKESIIISILKTQRPIAFVRRYVEQYYIDKFYSLQEKIIYAQSHKYLPDPAVFCKIEGEDWKNKFYCGNNPKIFARIVKNMILINNEDGSQMASWDEL